MGGYGSGGWNDTGRPLTGQTTPLDVNRIYKAGGFAEGQSLGWQWTWTSGQTSSITIQGRGRYRGVTLSYTHLSGPESIQVRQEVWVEWIPCRFGGERPFWRCPVCSRMCAKLYGWRGRHACRKCQRVGYQSQREKAHDRIQTRANKIRMKLGGEPGVENMPGKPKGMHWRTYDRYYAEIIAADDAFYRYIAMRWPGSGLV